MNLETSQINTINNRAKIVGILFIIGTTAGLLSQVCVGPVIGGTNYLQQFSVNQNQVLTGAFFELIMAAACASIAIWLFPVLRKYSESLALGAVGFRLMEGIFYVLAVISLILLLALSQEFANAGAPDSSYFQTAGALLKTGYNWINNVAVLLSWNVGALMYYYIFYQTKLIPRWLSGWGLVGVTLCIVGSMFVMFQYIDPMSTAQVVLNLPIALQEMALALWLIVKGFNLTATAIQPPHEPAVISGDL